MATHDQRPSKERHKRGANAGDAHSRSSAPLSSPASLAKPARRTPKAPSVSHTPRDAAPAHSGYQGEIPPPLVPPGGGTWAYVDRPEALVQVAETLASMSVLAIDAEFVQVYHRGPDDPPHRLALLQLAGAPGSQVAYVIDALRLDDLSPIQHALGDPAILKLFHGMGADVRVLATRRLIARHTLDLEAVSRSIFGSRESSLQNMLLRACGIRLDKSLQRSDWTRRPLLPAMLAYAARDASMTLALYHWLAARYPWAVALHEVAANPPTLVVAPWLQPLLESGRGQRAEWAVAHAGLDENRAQQAADLSAALSTMRAPVLRSRVIRFIGELELTELAEVLHPLLADQAAEVRTAAARTLGRLRDASAEPLLRALVTDPVQDVREAAGAGLAYLASGHGPRSPMVVTRTTRANASRWTLEARADDTAQFADEAPWQAALRARFPASASRASQASGASPQTDETNTQHGGSDDAT